MFQTALLFGWRDVYRELPAAEIVTERSRWVQNKTAACNELPTLFEVSLFSDEFEIVNINTEDQFEPTVEKETFPARNRFEIALQELLREVVLPVFATHWAAV